MTICRGVIMGSCEFVSLGNVLVWVVLGTGGLGICVSERFADWRGVGRVARLGDWGSEELRDCGFGMLGGVRVGVWEIWTVGA